MSSAGQGKFAGQRPTFYRCATQPTVSAEGLLALTAQNYDAKCIQLGCFHRGSTSLHSNFTRTGSSPINHCWQHNTRDTGLPDGEDRIPLRFVVLTQYRIVMDRQTQTNGRICRSIYNASKAIALRRAVKMILLDFVVWAINVVNACRNCRDRSALYAERSCRYSQK